MNLTKSTSSLLQPKSNNTPDSCVNHVFIFPYNFSHIAYMNICACVIMHVYFFSKRFILFYHVLEVQAIYVKLS